jgi:dynein heavy chain
MRTSPSLEAFEAELKKYMAIETEVTNISPVHNIGEYSTGGGGDQAGAA